jgi:hypothetical protein
MKLDARIEGTMPLLPYRNPAEYLTRVIRPRLKRAIDDEVLSISVHELQRFVRVTESKHVQGASEVVGGKINFRRDASVAELRTTGGGWVTFSACVKPEGERLALLGYNFERVFENGHIEFIRFDLNFEGQANQARGLRSHMHPGHDDWMLPAPILAPHELLDVMLTKFGPRGERSERSKGRGVTET